MNNTELQARMKESTIHALVSEREELRDWLFSQKQALDEARAERDRLREAIRTMMALPADARREMKRVGREALAAITEPGDEQ